MEAKNPTGKGIDREDRQIGNRKVSFNISEVTNESTYLSGLEGGLGEGMRVKCSAHCQAAKKW